MNTVFDSVEAELRQSDNLAYASVPLPNDREKPPWRKLSFRGLDLDEWCLVIEESQWSDEDEDPKCMRVQDAPNEVQAEALRLLPELFEEISEAENDKLGHLATLAEEFAAEVKALPVPPS